MIIREYTEYRQEDIKQLYASVGWTSYTDNLESLRKGFENSLLVLGAYTGRQAEEGRLVGLIRIVGDGYTIIFIQDLLVLPEFQRRGIGSALMRAVLEKYKDVRQCELATDNTPGSIAFYQSLGMKKYSDLGCCGFIRLGKEKIIQKVMLNQADNVMLGL